MASGDKDPGDFSLAKRMLQGMTSSEPEASAEPEASPSGAGPDPLRQILNALKQAPGRVSKIEPDGYGYLLRIRGGGEPLALRSRGDAVHALEAAFRKAGLPGVPSSGRFDETMETLVKDFQRAHDLKESGVFDAATFEALHSELGLDEVEEEKAAGAAAPIAAPRSQAHAEILPPTGNAFLDRLVPGAVRGMHASGMPASVLLAMAILESQWGERLLARDHNNVFALTGEGSAGSVIMCENARGGLSPSGEGTSYRSYKDPADSVADFAEVFAKAADYQGIMSHRGQPENFARALSGAYSPDPKYGSLVLRLMAQFELKRFDRIAPPSTDW